MMHGLISKQVIFLRYVIILLNIVVAVIPVCTYIFGCYYEMPEEDLIATILTVFLEAMLIVIGKMHDRKAEKCIWGKSKDKVLQEIKPSSRNELEKARDEMRFGLKILAMVSIFSLVIGFFAGWIKINIAIAIELCIVIAFIYADYLPHVKRYLREYDAYFVGDDKANETSGLARIYLGEYRECQLKRFSPFYKEQKDKPVFEPEDDEGYAKEFMKCVFGIRCTMKDQTLEILMWVMFALSALTISDELFQVLTHWMKEAYVLQLVFDMVSRLAPVLFMVVSICQIYECYEECRLVDTLWRAIESDDLDVMIPNYNSIVKKGLRGEQCRIRGAFVYSQERMERYHNISKVPMKYRMKFPDRFVANLVRYLYTYWLVVLIGGMLLLEVQWISTGVWIGYLTVAVVGYFVGRLLLPELNRRRIQRACRELEKLEKGTDE